MFGCPEVGEMIDNYNDRLSIKMAKIHHMQDRFHCVWDLLKMTCVNTQVYILNVL